MLASCAASPYCKLGGCRLEMYASCFRMSVAADREGRHILW